MIFRGRNRRWLFALFATLMLSEITASAATPSSYPFGIIIRKSVLSKLVDTVNQHPQAFEIDQCFEGFGNIGQWTVRAEFTPKLSAPNWIARPQQAVLLQARLDEFTAKGKILEGCHPPKENANSPFIDFQVTLKKNSGPLPISVWFYPESFSIDVSSHILTQVADQVELTTTQLGSFNRELNLSYFKLSILSLVAEMGGKAFGDWLQYRLRGLAYAESLGEILTNPERPERFLRFQEGPLEIIHSYEHLDRLELAFAVFPRVTDFISISQNALEFYFNALFLNSQELGSLDPSQANLPFSAQVRGLRSGLIRNLPFTDAPFSPPPIPFHSSDFSLVLTEDLVNEALEKIYREDLLSFTTSIDLGQSTQGLINPELADIKVRLDLASRAAPQLKFQADRLNLNVSDYVLRLGTALEDRLIPSTQIEVGVNLSAELGFDSRRQNITLVMDPTSFAISLKERPGKRLRKLKDDDLVILKDLAEGFWRKFFETFPELALFSPVFESENALIEARGVQVHDRLIMMHFDAQGVRP